MLLVIQAVAHHWSLGGFHDGHAKCFEKPLFPVIVWQRRCGIPLGSFEIAFVVALSMWAGSLISVVRRLHVFGHGGFGGGLESSCFIQLSTFS